jgi:hypothetical protein
VFQQRWSSFVGQDAASASGAADVLAYFDRPGTVDDA